MPQEGKAGAAVHLPHDPFRFGVHAFGTAVVVGQGLTQRALVQYRAWHLNTASLSLAACAGFIHYCNALVIRLANPPW